jgi:hypothetical protein
VQEKKSKKKRKNFFKKKGKKKKIKKQKKIPNPSKMSSSVCFVSSQPFPGLCYDPIFSAGADSSIDAIGAQTVPGGTSYYLVFPDVNFDRTGAFSVGLTSGPNEGSFFTAQVPGFYQFNTSATFSYPFGSTGQVGLSYQVFDSQGNLKTPVINAVYNVLGADNLSQSLAQSQVLALNGGDVVSVQILNNSVATLSITGADFSGSLQYRAV